jgi:hypothetical protein
MNVLLSGAITVAILAGLAAFSWFFNRYIERQGVDLDGFVWLLVVIGNLVTLAGVGLLDLVLQWNAGLIGLLAFAASGLPVSYGAFRRYIDRRRRLRDVVR